MTFDFDTVYDRTGTDSSKWHRFPPDVLPMFVADMDFRSPPAVRDALHARIDHGFFGYGREPEELFEVAANRIRERYDWRVQPEAIVAVPGVVAGVNLATRTFARPGDGLALQTPAYPPILHCAEKFGAEAKLARLVQAESGRYTPDWDEFDAAIAQSSTFVLCNPHNPVGRAFEREELQRMADVCLRTDTLIVSDEIHCDLMFPGHRHIPIASLSPEVEARTITFMAPSKTFNLPGLKCSIAIIPDQELRERFVEARMDLVRTPNILGVTAATAAYRDGGPWLDELLLYLEANRDYVTEFVREELPGVRVFPAEATYLAWLDCREAAIPGESPCEFFLEEAKVGLSDGATFGEDGRGFVRLNFASPRSLLEEGLRRMSVALKRRRD
jgi:cystathionine beta-lyase